MQQKLAETELQLEKVQDDGDKDDQVTKLEEEINSKQESINAITLSLEEAKQGLDQSQAEAREAAQQRDELVE